MWYVVGVICLLIFAGTVGSALYKGPGEMEEEDDDEVEDTPSDPVPSNVVVEETTPAPVNDEHFSDIH